MPIPKEIARKLGRFHKVSSDDLTDLQEYTEWLNSLLTGPCYVEEYDGELILIEIKQLVDRVDSLKIEIYSNEHPPPHFHVKSSTINASFSIDDCSLLKGDVTRKERKIIEFWHLKSKPLLIDIWNSTRPDECVVGFYKGT